MVKTGMGDIALEPHDVEEILQQIREIHVISYSGEKGHDPLDRYEKEFNGQGLKRLGKVAGPPELLVMCRRRSLGQYALVSRQKDNITVVRTDGVPDLGEVTKVLLETVAKATQRAVLAKKHS